MSATSHAKYCLSNLRSQRGAAFIVMIVVLVMGAATILVSSFGTATLQIERDKKTAEALAQAKEALISYAISSENVNGGTGAARPGNFPCPDNNVPSTGYESGSCSSGTVGRLPWRTLGVPELLDGYGEPLWYALSGNFRKVSSRINSDTKGTLQVYDRDGTTQLTPQGSEAVAIVFAPGTALGNQQRNSTLDKTTASNYLDTANSRNNSTVNGPFIAADKSDSFNDRLMIIRTRDFMPTIEKRVAKELQTILANYYADNGVYPFPASFSNCSSGSPSCDSDTSICRGRFPYKAKPTDWGGQPNYSLPTTAGGSPWFIQNRWYRVIYYSVGTDRLHSHPSGCPSTIHVDGNNKAALFFMPGTPLGTVVRTYTNNNLGWYLEDTENLDTDFNYVTPTSNSNDQLFILP